MSEYKIDKFSTAYYGIIWLLFFAIGTITTIKFLQYVTNLEEPMKLFGLTILILFMFKWFMWCGFPKIEYWPVDDGADKDV